MPYSPVVGAAIAILTPPIKDLYESGKDLFKDQLSKWNNAKSIASLASKVVAYEQVKTIWQREKTVKLSSFYYPSKVIFETGITGQISSLKDLPTDGGLIIQGTVGQGKSIFLRYLCIQELSNQSSGRIPIFIELRKLEPDFTLEQALFQELSALGFEISVDLFDFYAESGKLVVLLDGFDELDESLVRNVITKLEFWSQRYPKLQFVITSRPGAEIQKSNCFAIVKLAPLTNNENRLFLSKIGVKGKSLENLLSAIEKSTVEIKELLTTPLLLTLLVIVYQSEESIPNELPDFFKLLFTTVFTRHDRTKPAFNRVHKSGLTEGRLERLFEAFCYSVLRRNFTVNLKLEQFNTAFSDAQIFTGEKSELDGFKHDIVKVACLLQEDGLYITFIHKSLLEFFAAVFIKNCTDDQSMKIYRAIAKNWRSWRPTLQFLSHIDKYRFARYFAIPTLEQSLLYFDAPNGVVNPDSLSKMIKKFVTETNFLYGKEDGRYIFDVFSSRMLLAIMWPGIHSETYFSEGPVLRYFNNIYPNHIFLDQLISPPSKFFSQIRRKERFKVCLADIVTSEELEAAKQSWVAEIVQINDFLIGYRNLVAYEDEKADLLASFDF